MDIVSERILLKNVRFYSFDVLNGINTVLELDIITYENMLLGIEECDSHNASEAFSKFLQAHHCSWCFPWITYRISGNVVKIAADLGSEAKAIASYYATNFVSADQSIDVQFIDLYLGEVSGYSKLFLFSPFTSFAERLWIRCLENLRNALQQEVSQNLLQGIIDALKTHDPSSRLVILADAIARNTPTNTDIQSAAQEFLPQIGVMMRGESPYEKIAIVFPELHMQFIAEELGRKIYELFKPQYCILWIPHKISNIANQIQDHFSKKCNCKKVDRRYYVLNVKESYMKAIKQAENVATQIWHSVEPKNSSSRGAIVIAVDINKQLLIALVNKVLERKEKRVSLFIASPRISLKDSKKPHITGVPIDIVKVM